MNAMRTSALSALLLAGFIGAAAAQSGPVATACGDDIGKLCAGKAHDGSVRVCLEQAYDKLSAACKTALDTTGGGRGKGLIGLGKGMGKGK